MKGLLLAVCISSIALLGMTGCDKFVTPTGVNSANALTRYVDSENGVICYQDNAKRDAFSCVKVKP